MSRFDTERAVLASDLASSARLVLLVLLVRADARTAQVPEKYTPSLAELARDTGLTRRGVMKTLDGLESDGWLIRTRPPADKARMGAKTLYRINAPAREHSSLQVGNSVPQGREPDSPGVGNLVHIGREPSSLKRRQPQTNPISACEGAREPWDSKAVQNAIIEEIENLSGKVVDRSHARLEAKRLLDGRSVNDVNRYVRMSLRNAASAGRLGDHLPTPQPPNWREEPA